MLDRAILLIPKLAVSASSQEAIAMIVGLIVLPVVGPGSISIDERRSNSG